MQREPGLGVNSSQDYREYRAMTKGSPVSDVEQWHFP